MGDPLRSWNAGIPLLLMPVRLETAYVAGDGHEELRIRMLPDPATVAGAPPASATELAEGRAYWTAYYAATSQPSQPVQPVQPAEPAQPSQSSRSAAWRRYAGRLGSRRAGYVARLTRPTVAADGTLAFPDGDPEADPPGFAALLPDRWLATGWVGDVVAFRAVGRPIVKPLATSPDPHARPVRLGRSGLVVDPATAWLFDYDAALDRGMAITVELTGAAAIASRGVSTLIVLGLDESQHPDRAAAELTSVLERHVRGAGLGFVRQGTPTNNTATVAAGYQPDETDLAGVRAREFDPPAPSTQDNASRLARALGLADDGMLRRLADGADREAGRSRNMRTAMFQTVLGTCLSSLLATNARDRSHLTGGIEPAALRALREWFVEWVTGGAPVPTIRIGRQPYGILPVMAQPAGDDPPSTRQRIAAVVAVLREEWRAALAAVPRLSHNATDADRDPDPDTDPDQADADPDQADADARDTVTAVLANNPHPRRLTVRTATDWSDEAPFEPHALTVHSRLDQIPMEIPGGFRWEYDQAIAVLDDRYRDTLKPLYDQVLRVVVPGGDIQGISEQLEVWTELDASIDNGFTNPWEIAEYFEEFHEFTADVIEQLTGHELRQHPLRWLDVPGLDGVLGRGDLQLLFTRFSSAARLWQRAVVQDEEPPGGVTARAYLSDLADRVATTGASRLPAEFLDAAPLLYQLLDAVSAVDDDREARRAALRQLATLDVTELDWLLRETLGLGSHRLDAWYTSLAAERLSRMRDQQPAGIYLGSFGFVLGLVRSDTRPSKGFLHAPSLPQAASAAVLRSGWLTRGNGDDGAPTAIDLSSARLRDADWLLAGVRNGQDLGGLLGARLERELHDAGLDVAVRPLRLAAGAAGAGGVAAGGVAAGGVAAGGSGRPAADSPVDGVRLLDLYRAGGLADTVKALALPEVQNRRLVAILDDLDSVFDATDDATTFESVHQLVLGNLERAVAVLDGMGRNGGRPPELLGARVPRSATTIDTRALVLIDASATSTDSGWAPGTRNRFDPALDAWVAGLLPPPADVGWLGITPDGTAVELRLDQASLSTLDAVFLADDNPLSVGPGLRRLVELAHPDQTFVELRATEGGSAPGTLAEFQLLAVELRRLILQAAPADPGSLLGADAGDSTVDTSGAVQRARNALAPVLRAYDAVASAAGWADLSTPDALELARIGLVPATTGDPDTDFADLRSRLERRASRADAVKAPGTIEGIRQRVAELLGAPVPLLGSFAVPAGDGGDCAVGLSATIASQDEVDDWLDLIGTVRPKVGRLCRAVMLGGLLGAPAPQLLAGQLPLVDGEPWIALHQPRTGLTGRVAVAAVVHGTVTPGTPVVGLVIDSWADRVPAGEQMTGVAFHHDAPSTQPPQSMLLVVPPEGRSWSRDLVLDTVLETIEWAQLRTVAIDDLGDYGQALPTVVVSGTLSAGKPGRAAS